MSREIKTDLTPEVRAIEAALVASQKAVATFGENSPEAVKAREALDRVARRTITRLDEVWVAEAEIGTPH